MYISNRYRFMPRLGKLANTPAYWEMDNYIPLITAVLAIFAARYTAGLNPNINQELKKLDLKTLKLLLFLGKNTPMAVVAAVGRVCGILAVIMFVLMFIAGLFKNHNQSLALVLTTGFFGSLMAWVAIKSITQFQEFALNALFFMMIIPLMLLVAPVMDSLGFPPVTASMSRPMVPLLQHYGIDISDGHSIFYMAFMCMLFLEGLFIATWVVGMVAFWLLVVGAAVIVAGPIYLGRLVPLLSKTEPLTVICFLLLLLIGCRQVYQNFQH